MSEHRYGRAFLQYTTAANEASARRIVSIVRSWLPVSSVADFGCGQGVWLATWVALGISDVQGVDGDYVDPAGLCIDPARFRATDLAQPLDLGRRFDLVQCLEVAEHLPSRAAPGLVRTLTRHSDFVLFSAAPPGQGGEHHINERPYGWWRDLFAAEGFDLFDCVRPRLRTAADVQPWYRYNMFLYIHGRRAGDLPARVRDARVAPGASVLDVSPLLYRGRKALIRQLPPQARDGLARFKAVATEVLLTSLRKGGSRFAVRAPGQERGGTKHPEE